MGRIEDDADLDAAFRTIKIYRANAIPLTQQTAAATVGACLRSGRADIGAHVLNFHRYLRVWPSADEYVAVIAALLEDGPEDRPRVAEALSLLDGAAQSRIAMPQASVDAVVQAAAVSAGNREASRSQASAAGADEQASSDDGEASDDAGGAEDGEIDAADVQHGIPLRKLEKVLLAAAETGAQYFATCCCWVVTASDILCARAFEHSSLPVLAHLREYTICSGL